MTTHSPERNKKTHPMDATATAPSSEAINNSTASTSAVTERPKPSPLRGGKKPWTPWQDWVNVALGLYLLLAPWWTAGAPVGWFVTFGILATAVGLWAAGTGSSSAAEWGQIIIGVVLLLSPFFGNFAAVSTTAVASAGAWTAWIIGGAIVALAATAMYHNRPRGESVPTVG